MLSYFTEIIHLCLESFAFEVIFDNFEHALAAGDRKDRVADEQTAEDLRVQVLNHTVIFQLNENSFELLEVALVVSLVGSVAHSGQSDLVTFIYPWAFL